MKKLTLILIFLFSTSTNGIFAQSTTELYKEADEALESGLYSKAEAKFTEAIDSDPNFARGYYGRGMARLYNGKIPDAIDDFTDCINLDPDFPDAYNGRGLSYQIMGEMHKAIDDFKDAVKYDPEFGEAHFNLAQTYFEIGELDESKAAMDQAMKYISGNPKAYALNGEINYALKNYSKAVEYYSKALELGEVDAHIYFNRGNSNFKLENYSKAVDDFTKALELDPGLNLALNNRAVANELAGDSLAALQDRQKLDKIRKAMFPDVNSLTFETHFSPDSIFTIQLPNSWNIKENVSKDGEWRLITTPEGLDPDKYSPNSIGIYIYFERNIDKKYPVKNEPEMLNFWEKKRKEAGLKNHLYELNEKKSYAIEGKPALRNLITYQPANDGSIMGMIETAVVINENLLHVYPQTPMEYWETFEPIYMKIVKSINIK